MKQLLAILELDQYIIDYFIDFIGIIECDPGYYWHHTELQCEMCPPYAYSPTGDNCIRCPGNQTTHQEGSTGAADCRESKKQIHTWITIIH